MFVAMGLSAVFPVLHGVSLYGVQQMRQSIGLSWLVLQGALYIIGAGLYAVSGNACVTSLTAFLVANVMQARIPERLEPGKFDVWGSSHQIFHILILLAAMSQLIGLLTAFHYARAFPSC